MTDLWYFTAEDKAYFQTIVPGEEVILAGRAVYGDTPHRVVKVDRVTPQRIIVGDIQYRRSDGRELGAYDWNGPDHLYRPTPERLAEVKIERQERAERREKSDLLNKIDRKFRAAPLEILRAIVALLEREREDEA